MGLLTDKVVVISGAGSGIGQATAKLLVEEGAKVTITDINQLALENTASHLPKNSDYLAIKADVRDPLDWQQTIQRTLGQWHKLDGLVNNAGIAHQKAIKEMDLAKFQQVLAVNLEGAFLGLKYAHEAMKQNPDGGSIVNISSVLGQLGMANNTAYSASKGGCRLMTKAAAIEFGIANTKIRVNSVHPGAVVTPMLTQEQRQTVLPAIPLGQLAQPLEVAKAIAFLLSDGAKFMTGSEVTVDGGWTSQLPLPQPLDGGTAP